MSHPPRWDELKSLNETTEGKTVTVTMGDGEVVKGRDFLAHLDSIEWTTDSASEQIHYIIATDQIFRVDVVPASFSYRLLQGVVYGTGLGLIAGIALATDPSAEPPSFKSAIEGIGILTGLGFIIGTFYGVCNGTFSLIDNAKDEYYLALPPDEAESRLDQLRGSSMMR